MAFRWVVPLLVAVMFAGCSSGGQVVISASGGGSGQSTKQLDCDGDGQITVSVSGGGSLTVVVTDGGGNVIYEDAGGGSPSRSDVQTLRGESGTWHLEAQWNEVGGSVSIVLQC